MSIIRARQPGLTRRFPHNGNARFLIPRAGVRPEPVVFSPPAGAVASGTSVTMTSPDGLPIYYTVDGDTPDMVYLYTGPVAILGATSFKAAAKADGWMRSDISEASYTLSDSANFVRWEFDTSLDGWFGVAGTALTLGPAGKATALRTAASGGAQIQRTTVSSGQTGLIWRYVKLNFDRVTDGGTAPNQNMRWANSIHGIQSSYQLTLSIPTADGGTNYQANWDMWASAQAEDWKASDILDLAMLIGANGTGPVMEYRLNWIEVRKEGFP